MLKPYSWSSNFTRLSGDCTKAIQPLLTLVRTSGLTSVLKAIRVGLYPTIDEINVTNFVTSRVTGFTDVNDLVMVLEWQAALNAEVCKNEHDPFF